MVLGQMFLLAIGVKVLELEQRKSFSFYPAHPTSAINLTVKIIVASISGTGWLTSRAWILTASCWI